MQPHFDAKELLSPPIKRAAYSDRTAWLMAEMSRLAYNKFEGGASISQLAQELAKIGNNKKKIESILKDHLKNIGVTSKKAKDDLSKQLAKANFQIINIYNKSDTQAFLAKLDGDEGRESMLVLAFRGTETNLADIKTDLDAAIIPVSGDEKAHKGFFKAFTAVKDEIERDLSDHSGIPIYITGHSLGGALAILGTRFLASDSLGACYTFGGPRVGNNALAKNIKTPIYRIVNSADVVPRVPPSWFLGSIVKLLEWFPLIPRFIINSLNQFRGYVHFGDMRYLSHVADTKDASGVPYANLDLISNPAMPFRFMWLFKRVVATWGKAGAQDHSIDLYCEKLKAYARRRNQKH